MQGTGLTIRRIQFLAQGHFDRRTALNVQTHSDRSYFHGFHAHEDVHQDTDIV